MGYHSDTCAAIIMQLFEDKKCPHDDLEKNVTYEVYLQMFSDSVISLIYKHLIKDININVNHAEIIF
jgi:hypothetical protein